MSNLKLFPTLVRLYHSTFNREADKSGIGWWANQLDKTNLTLEDVASRFMDSEEFVGLYPEGLTQEEFVTLLYNNVLGRDPDLEGLEYWVEALENGIPREKILLDFSESEENQLATEEQVSDEISGLLGIELSSVDKTGAQKVVLDKGVSETVTIGDDAVKAQIHEVTLGDTLGDTVVLPYSLIEDVAELASAPEIFYGGTEDSNSILGILKSGDDTGTVDAYQEWVDFFFADDKNKIELEWELGLDDVVAIGDYYEIELKLMYKDGFVKLHDIEIDSDTFLGFDLSGSDEVTMHRDNQDDTLFHVDSEFGDVPAEIGENAIQLVGYLIQVGLIDIADSI